MRYFKFTNEFLSETKLGLRVTPLCAECKRPGFMCRGVDGHGEMCISQNVKLLEINKPLSVFKLRFEHARLHGVISSQTLSVSSSETVGGLRCASAVRLQLDCRQLLHSWKLLPRSAQTDPAALQEAGRSHVPRPATQSTCFNSLNVCFLFNCSS